MLYSHPRYRNGAYRIHCPIKSKIRVIFIGYWILDIGYDIATIIELADLWKKIVLAIIRI